MSQYTIVDLFAGVGGLSFGFDRLPNSRSLPPTRSKKTSPPPIP